MLKTGESADFSQNILPMWYGRKCQKNTDTRRLGFGGENSGKQTILEGRSKFTSEFSFTIQSCA